MYRRILLPLDGSNRGKQALSHAIAHAKEFGAELVVLKALPSGPITQGLDDNTRQWAKKYTTSMAREHLEKVAAALEQHGIVVHTSTVEDNSPARIVQSAKENAVDLIVMPTGKPAGLARWFGNSPADRVARETTIPVLLVQDSDTGENNAR
ncbi:MAG: universal stress protein [Anaerolineae bacterium]|jgi:nucleotide-binding universal stress UspA family protein